MLLFKSSGTPGVHEKTGLSALAYEEKMFLPHPGLGEYDHSLAMIK